MYWIAAVLLGLVAAERPQSRLAGMISRLERRNSVPVRTRISREVKLIARNGVEDSVAKRDLWSWYGGPRLARPVGAAI